MANNIQDGVYNAMPTVAAVYEKNDALKLEIHFTLCDEGGNPYTQTGSDGNEYPIEKYKYYNLVNAQGVVSTKIIDGISAWSKWDGTDPFWWTDKANVDAIGMVEVTLKTQTWQGKTYQNIEWVNEPGHSAKHGGGTITQSGDKAAIMAKYGAKFKAAFGGKPKPATPAAKPVVPATPKNAPAARPAPSAPTPKATATKPLAYPDGMDGANAVWDALQNANPGVKQGELEERWFAALDEVVPGKDQQDVLGEEWEQVALKVLQAPDDIPF